LGKPPSKKYQNEGGPSAGDIFNLIRDRSSKRTEDAMRFLDAIIYNWLIGGTDAHSKNYGFLLAVGNRVRFAPLYDLSSSLPYPLSIPPKKAKLAMKIGGEYKLDRIGARQWEKAAGEWKLDRGLVGERVVTMARRLPEAAELVAKEMRGSGVVGEMLERLVEGVGGSASKALGMFAEE
jgi:serine/threonine-protein kinase HipA